MNKTKRYEHTFFGPAAITEAKDLFESLIDTEEHEEYNSSLIVEVGSEVWEHDSFDEFVADLRRQPSYYRFKILRRGYDLLVTFSSHASDVSVGAPSRSEVERVFEVFEQQLPSSKIVPPVSKEIAPVVFIGHGRSNQWKELKDHLHEKHNYKVEAYEIGARAGHAVRDILQEMLRKSSFAILVLTGEDKLADGPLMARPNVIHELGLFQGRIGFSRAIVLLEEGAQEFSNIHGIQQIRYSKGRIIETFGEVLATLKREFG